MPGPKLVLDRGVISGPLIGILDEQSDRRPGGLAVKDARQNPHLVRFLALRGMARASGTPPVQVHLYVRFAQFQAGRAAVHDGAQRRAVAFAVSCDAEQAPYGVAGHAAIRRRGWKGPILRSHESFPGKVGPHIIPGNAITGA